MSLHSDEFPLQEPDVPLSIMASELEFQHKPQTRQKETFLQTNFIYLPRFGTGKSDTRLLQKQREAFLK